MRKGTLSNGLWKWWNFKDKFIILRKKKHNRKKSRGKTKA